jgi:hypothetical protein
MYKLHSVCRNYTLRVLLVLKLHFACINHTHVGENCTLRVKITLLRDEITLVRFEITLLSVVIADLFIFFLLSRRGRGGTYYP